MYNVISNDKTGTKLDQKVKVVEEEVVMEIVVVGVVVDILTLIWVQGGGILPHPL